MNLAARELGLRSAEKQRAPMLAKARAMREAFGLAPVAALEPTLILSLGDRL